MRRFEPKSILQLGKPLYCAIPFVLSACTWHQSEAAPHSPRSNDETTTVVEVHEEAATFSEVHREDNTHEGREEGEEASRLELEDTVAIDENNRCVFDTATLSFEGSASAQARCLLRPVRRYANLGAPARELPEPLASLIGRPCTLDTSSIRRYLDEQGISEADIGGSLDEPVSRARDNHPDAPFARYFVIHDTSTPLFENDEAFPVDINAVSWRHNRLNRWLQGNPIAHIFANRVGDSVSPVGLDTPWRATKFELRTLGNDGKGLFLHVELVQPRRKDQNGIDAFSPEPGFSNPQLDRLALVYVAASVRRGEWLIPAFHAVLDTGFPNGHDDPQNFDLDDWAARLGSLIESF